MPEKISTLPEELNASFKAGDKIIIRFNEKGWDKWAYDLKISEGDKGTIIGFTEYITRNTGENKMERHVNPNWCFVQVDGKTDPIKISTINLDLQDERLKGKRDSMPAQDARERLHLTFVSEIPMTNGR